MARFLIATVLFIASSATWGQTAMPLMAQDVVPLFDAGEFQKLEDLAEGFRQRKEISRAGTWQIGEFYSFLDVHGVNIARESEEKFRESIGRWEKAFPDSITWRVVKAGSLRWIGWDKRGGEFAHKVTSEQWKGFYEYFAEAWTLLQEVRRMRHDEVAVYPILIDMAMGAGGDPTRRDDGVVREFLRDATGPGIPPPNDSVAHQLLMQSIAVNKDYFPSYRSYAYFITPRWGGGDTELEEFAAWAADTTQAERGDSFYARVASAILLREGEELYIRTRSFDWKRIKNGLDRILQDFPESNVWANLATRQACTHEDLDAALGYRGRIKVTMTDRAWLSLRRLEVWTNWMDGKGPYPRANKLAAAILWKDIPDLHHLLDQGEDINAIDVTNSTPLFLAVSKEYPEGMRVLIKRGAEVDNISGPGNSPLGEAIYHKGDIGMEMIQILLDAGADPHFPNAKDWKPLHAAVLQKRYEVVELFLNRGARVDEQMANGATPLHVAAGFGHLPLAKLLIKHGADPTIKMNNGNTPHALAVIEDEKDMAAYLESLPTKN